MHINFFESDVRKCEKSPSLKVFTAIKNALKSTKLLRKAKRLFAKFFRLSQLKKNTYRLISSAVDLKLIFLTNLARKAPLIFTS